MKFLIFIFFLILFSKTVEAQFLNKEVEAKIVVENKGEFIKFNAIAENKSMADLNLTYDFLTFVKNNQGEVIKESLTGRFVLATGERTKLDELDFNATEDRRIIILFLINDEDGKPLGQDRIVLNDTTINSAKPIVLDKKFLQKELAQGAEKRNDMAQPQDGFILEGLVVENSITKMGQDFYRLFYSKYYLSGLKSEKDIVIDELPFRARTTRISVKVDNQLVWQFFSNPSQEFLKQQSELAFSRVVARLQQIENTKEQITRY